MTNLTITVDAEVARWAKVWAARCGTSVSRLVGELLRRQMLEEDGYPAAMAHYLSVTPRPLKETGGYPTREELHGRQRLR